MATKTISAPAPGAIPPPAGVAVAPETRPDARRHGAPVWLKNAPGEVLDSYDRLLFALQVAGDMNDAKRAASEFISELSQVEKKPDEPPPIPKEQTEKVIDVPGEGSFAVRVNHLGKVELICNVPIPGTGLHKSDLFAEEPLRAIQLVQATVASPRQPGGVRRVKGPAPGEQIASV
jgi:hypothetical protein